MIRPGAWRLLKIVGRGKTEVTDYYSHKIKHIIRDKDTNEYFVCDSSNYELLDKENFKLYENEHNCEFILKKQNSSIYHINLDDIWVNQIMGGR
jgi:hypothetical protein